MFNRILTILFLSFSCISIAQFSFDKEQEISECDCNTQLDEMYIKIPTINIAAFDRIGIRIMNPKNARVLGSALYTVSDFSTLNGGHINLLNPNELGQQNIFGVESALFKGQHINLSYNALCKYSKTYEIEFNVTGIKQVGTETTYSLSGNRVTARSKKIFDSGTIIYTSNAIKVNTINKTKEKNFPYLGYPVYFGGIIAGTVMYPILTALSK